jgi:SAM-dependent methyltransferase
VIERVVRGTNDLDYVAAQYASEGGLAARKAAYSDVSGPDAHELAFAAVAELDPTTVLEVGCGEGELAARMTQELEASVVAVDQSPRMVELTRARGVDGRIADVQRLPFPDASFDVVLAAWMLYHVPDLPRALSEISRVLRPGGRLVAVTNAADHLRELFALGGIDHWELPFGAENAELLLREHLPQVERRDAYGTVSFADIDAVRAYYASSERLQPHSAALPDYLAEPLFARRRPVVFVADKAE